MGHDTTVKTAIAVGTFQFEGITGSLSVVRRKLHVPQAIFIQITQLEGHIAHLHCTVGANPD